LELDRVKLQWFEDLLWARYSELRAVEERLSGPGGLGEPATVALGELSAYDQHPGDFGTEMYERSKDLGLLENTRHQLRQIAAVLKAIETGTYGRCSVCGRAIPEERLEAIPETQLCVECSEAQASADRTGRPIEEETLSTHLGRSFDEVSWEEAARHGTASDLPDR
jgi:YteA family regulatory protein